MGQEINHSFFSDNDFELFARHLRHETGLLHDWVREGLFRQQEAESGFELEAWLLNPDASPAPVNQHFLTALDDAMAVPELARFNFELNGIPRRLKGDALRKMYMGLTAIWHDCRQVASDLGVGILAIGTLPGVDPAVFNMANMSGQKRYTALNEQILRLRHGKPLTLDIQGRDTLLLNHPDVMLEAAATSFQIHLRMPYEKAARIYNAGKIISAPMVAVSANSPYLFGRDLWCETRIPVFEQAVQVGQSDLTHRVSFGIRYAQSSILEVFDSNLARYPVLLPRIMDEAPEMLAHLRLHNGTIWRWNRPLIGFDEDGAPHFRLEHRVVPAGPSMLDSVANAAFFYGLVTELAAAETAPETRLPFQQAKANFYGCARLGLDAEITWLDNKTVGVRQLCLDVLLDMALSGLKRLQIDEDERFYWIGIIESRLLSGQNGASWQRNWVKRYGSDMVGMMNAYKQWQETGLPVHEWAPGEP